MKKPSLFILIASVCVVAVVFFLYQFNTCSEGGLMGNLNKCDCLGIKIKKTAVVYPDSLEEYSCIGLIK